LISDACEVPPDLLVVLQHLQVLTDGLEEGIAELPDLFRVDDAAFEQIFGLVDQYSVPIVGESFAERAFEEFKVDLIGNDAFEGGQFESDGVVLAQMLQHVLPQRFLSDHLNDIIGHR
jgi:hypothetical protein